MKRREFLKKVYVPTVFGIFVPTIIRSQGFSDPAFLAAIEDDPAGGAAPSYLVEENFEGAGQPAGWSDVGSPNYDFDVSGFSMQGSQGVELAGDNDRATPPSFGVAQAEAWAFFQFRVTVKNSGFTFFVFLGPGVSAEVQAGNTIRIGGSVNGNPTDNTISLDTTYHAWARYKKGTGANAEFEFGYSTTTTKPVAGTAFRSIATTGTETVDCTGIQLRSESGATNTIIFDKLRADDANIGDNPS